MTFDDSSVALNEISLFCHWFYFLYEHLLHFSAPIKENGDCLFIYFGRLNLGANKVPFFLLFMLRLG